MLVEELRHEPFEWGKHDCLTFINAAHKAMTGKALCDDWQGGYSDSLSALERYKAVRASLSCFDGHNENSTIIDAMDSRLKRIDLTVPPRGSLAAREQPAMVFGYAMGVSMGKSIAFLGMGGLMFLPPLAADVFWLVK